MTLTRNDRRVSPENQRPGTWLLHVPRGATTEIKVYFRDPTEGGTAYLTLNDATHESKRVVDGWYVFERIKLQPGDLSLRSYMMSGENDLQAWQIEIDAT